MKKNKKVQENYLERRPMRPQHIQWSVDEEGLVTLAIENTGLMNRIAQKLLKKPKVSYIHLDEIGSFLWPLLEGEQTISELGVKVEQQFGEAAHPLYERLAQYFGILDSYRFIQWK